MKTKEIIKKLRKEKNLTQEEFADSLSVTRQAVSRWETGKTVPSHDLLNVISKKYNVSIDYLLGYSESITCQSCGCEIDYNSRGSEKDGSKSKDYCRSCYTAGAFNNDFTMDEMIETNLLYLEVWNKETGNNFSKDGAREELKKFMPTLKRWKEKQ